MTSPIDRPATPPLPTTRDHRRARGWLVVAGVLLLAGTVAIAVVVLPRLLGQEGEAKDPLMIGAYVDPELYIDEQRISAFESFEEELGEPLDIYHSYHPWAEHFPSTGDLHFAERGTTLLLSWAGTDTRDITAGIHDELIRERAQALRDLERDTGAEVILQWRWEMNRPNLREEIHSPADYAAAWRHLHDLFVEEGAGEIEWAWCPLADEVADDDFDAYYPGDAYVDWIGANGYARSTDQTFADVFAEFFAWAETIDRPILIGEFARPVDMGSPESLQVWLDGARRTVKARPQIKAVVYFESARGASGDYAVAGIEPAMRVLRRWVEETGP